MSFCYTELLNGMPYQKKLTTVISCFTIDELVKQSDGLEPYAIALIMVGAVVFVVIIVVVTAVVCMLLYVREEKVHQ